MKRIFNVNWLSLPVSSKPELIAFWSIFIFVLLVGFFVDSVNGPFPPVPIFYLTTFGVAIWFWQHRWLRFLALNIAILQSIGRVASIGWLDLPIQSTAFSVFVAVLRANFLCVFVAFVYQQRCLQDRLKLSLRRLTEAREAERRTIASALHDELGQTISVITMNLTQLREHVDDAGAKTLELSLQRCDQALQQVRNTAHGLRPLVLDDLGLAAASRSLLSSLKDHASFDIDLTENIGSRRFNKHVETLCFRAIQEALTNAIRYSNATQVDIDISADDHALTCRVQDDGRGFDVRRALIPNDVQAGFGLANLNHVVYGFGGSLSVKSRIDEGVSVSITVPLEKIVTK